MAAPPRRRARERLLAAAGQLFYARGITATGIDTITGSAGVARKSLYDNFSSKDELVLAVLRERHREWMRLYAARRDAATDPRGRVLAVVDAYLDHAALAVDGFRGCGLLNAAAELPVGSSAREVVRDHKEQVQELLRIHLAEDGSAAPEDLAVHISLLLEGSMVRSGLAHDPAGLDAARRLVLSLLASDGVSRR